MDVNFIILLIPFVLKNVFSSLLFGLFKMLLSLKSLPLLIYFQCISLNWQLLSTPYVTVAIRNTLNYKQEKNLIVGLEYKIYQTVRS